MMSDTIAAIATAAGEGGIGIVRISGAKAFLIAERMFVCNNGRELTQVRARFATLGQVVSDGETIDEAIALKFQTPASYTGEDVIEFQAHGGSVACRRILQMAIENGARLAEPGEFTKRAFLNGRIDLAQAEAVIDVIRARTDAALRAANRSLCGKMSAAVKKLRGELLKLLAHIAVAVDYPEEDIEDVLTEDVRTAVVEWRVELEDIIKKAASGRILRDGLRTSIIGKPNAGKSSLMNELLGVERAIVTAIPGTTRDTIEEYADFDGIPLLLIDTAGLRVAADEVEQIGVNRAQAAAGDAELVIYVVDGVVGITKEDVENIRTYISKTILVINKSDLGITIDINDLPNGLDAIPVVVASAVDGTGIEDLKKAVRQKVYSEGVQPEQVALVNVRQLEALGQACRSLLETEKAIAAGMPPDVLGVDLRLAWEVLGEITGDTVSEDLLDKIFSEFCVGK